MNFKTITVKIENRVLRIILNRPEKRNALNKQMVEEIHQIFAQNAENDQILAATITGEGSVFCAGADLSYLNSLVDKSYEENLEDSRQIKDMYWSIYTFPKPTVAIVNGPAVAGGCGLVNVCDISIAARDAGFGYPEVRIGFVAAIVSVFLLYTVGLRRSLEMLLTGRIIDALSAQNFGLIHTVVDKDELFSQADLMLRDLKRNSPEALKLSKQLIQSYTIEDLKKNLEDACLFNARSRGNPDFKEGLLSFIEKREPVWQKNSQ